MIDKEMTHKVWRLLDDGKTLSDIEGILLTEAPSPKEAERVPSKTTFGRLKSIRDKLEKESTGERITSKSVWKPKRVSQLRGWWEEYNRLKGTPVETPRFNRQRHIDRLLELASQIRERIVNPHLELRTYTDESIWDWASESWRLSPRAWFYVMTPYLPDEKLWGRQFPYLKAHLEKSLFWQHYEELGKEASKLETEYHEAAKKLAEENPGFGKAWEHIQEELEVYVESVWAPNVASPPEEMADLPWDEGICRDMLSEFAKLIPDMDDRFQKMERQLQQLWDDLDPDVIEPLIERGSCKLCSKIAVDHSGSSDKPS